MIEVPQHEQQLSVIGSQLCQPIADLLEGLLSRPHRKDRVTSTYFEGGYATSIIVLLAIFVESMVARDRYLNAKGKGHESKRVPEYMKATYRYRAHEQLSELFVLRDAIVHNHLWMLESQWSKQGRRRLISAMIEPWSGDKRFRRRLNAKSFRTKRLRASVIPSRMDRTDVAKAFRVTLAVLETLAKRGEHPALASLTHVRFQGKNVRFSSLLEPLTPRH